VPGSREPVDVGLPGQGPRHELFVYVTDLDAAVDQ
jgi:hypothetical protein